LNELIQLLQEKTGLTEDPENAAVNHIMEYLKSKVPESFHQYLDGAAPGDTLRTKGTAYLFQDQSAGSDILKVAEEKISGFLHTKES
jgi:hypothetical protein